MKYEKERYLNSGFYGDDDSEIENYQEKIVKCRKPHKCVGGCNTKIKAGETALCETGFMDCKPVRAYTCLTCIENWLKVSGQVADVERE
jgi:hypothetical protein